MEGRRTSICDLTEDALLLIFKLCDIRTLGRLASTCKTFHRVISSNDTLWREYSFTVLGSNMRAPAMQQRCRPILLFKDRCKLGKVWEKMLRNSTELAYFKKCMPWIVMTRDYLFFSKGKTIVQFQRAENGDVYKWPSINFTPSNDDIAKFAVNDNEVVCAGRDGVLTRLRKHNLIPVDSIWAHSKDILTVASKKDIIITGSLDCSIKIWKSYSDVTDHKETIYLDNRVLSTSIMPSNDLFVVGTAGTNYVHPLQLFDLERGEHIINLGRSYRYGAGVLDIFPDSYQTFYSCGYDSSVQLWDIRCPYVSVATWEEPFDTTLYCVKSDYNMTIMAGTARNGSFLIWDRRSDKTAIHDCVLYRGFSRRNLSRHPHQFHQTYRFWLKSNPRESRRSSVISSDGPIPVCQNYYVASWYNRQKQFKESPSFFQGPVFSLDFDAAHVYVAFEKLLIEFSYMSVLDPKFEWSTVFHPRGSQKRNQYPVSYRF